jgi:hypothetical protein
MVRSGSKEKELPVLQQQAPIICPPHKNTAIPPPANRFDGGCLTKLQVQMCEQFDTNEFRLSTVFSRR